MTIDREHTDASAASTFSSADTIPGEEYVRWAYRLLHGREPENSAILRTFPHNRELLIKAIISSYEFRTKHADLLRVEGSHPYHSWDKEALYFIHLPKTGGTTLHELLMSNFNTTRVFPERHGYLHLYTPAQLAEYDFFSGHFDYFSLRFIPRRVVRRISILREPCQRLISWYRFNRSHPMTHDFARNMTVKLAHELTPEAFFAAPEIALQTDVNNSYLFYFGSAATDPVMIKTLVKESINVTGSTPSNSAQRGDVFVGNSVAAEILMRAIKRVIKLDCVGITERFEESVRLIFSTLGFTIPTSITRQMVTDELSKADARFSLVPPVEITPRLSRTLERLTRYDRVIYDAARREFERRLSCRSQPG